MAVHENMTAASIKYQQQQKTTKQLQSDILYYIYILLIS